MPKKNEMRTKLTTPIVTTKTRIYRLQDSNNYQRVHVIAMMHQYAYTRTPPAKLNVK